jgi:hypothetical protein
MPTKESSISVSAMKTHHVWERQSKQRKKKGSPKTSLEKCHRKGKRFPSNIKTVDKTKREAIVEDTTTIASLQRKKQQTGIRSSSKNHWIN